MASTASQSAGFHRNPQHLPAIRRLAAGRVVRAADAVTRRVKTLLHEPGLGVDHPGKPYPSSAPGDPPTTQSGRLAASQTTRGPSVSDTAAVAASGSDEIKAFWLQAGTATIAPRPYMLRSLLDSRDQALQAFAGQGVSP